MYNINVQRDLYSSCPLDVSLFERSGGGFTFNWSGGGFVQILGSVRKLGENVRAVKAQCLHFVDNLFFFNLKVKKKNLT